MFTKSLRKTNAIFLSFILAFLQTPVSFADPTSIDPAMNSNTPTVSAFAEAAPHEGVIVGMPERDSNPDSPLSEVKMRTTIIYVDENGQMAERGGELVRAEPPLPDGGPQTAPAFLLPVMNLVNELQNNGYKVTFSSREDGSYSIHAIDAKNHLMAPKSGLYEISFVASGDGTIDSKSVRATYYGVGKVDGSLLFDAMRACPQDQMCPAVVKGDLQVLEEMIPLKVTKSENSVIHFNKYEKNYKAYRDAKGRVVVEEVKNFDIVPRTALEAAENFVVAVKAAVGSKDKNSSESFDLYGDDQAGRGVINIVDVSRAKFIATTIKNGKEVVLPPSSYDLYEFILNRLVARNVSGMPEIQAAFSQLVSKGPLPIIVEATKITESTSMDSLVIKDGEAVVLGPSSPKNVSETRVDIKEAPTQEKEYFPVDVLTPTTVPVTKIPLAPSAGDVTVGMPADADTANGTFTRVEDFVSVLPVAPTPSVAYINEAPKAAEEPVTPLYLPTPSQAAMNLVDAIKAVSGANLGDENYSEVLDLYDPARDDFENGKGRITTSDVNKARYIAGIIADNKKITLSAASYELYVAIFQHLVDSDAGDRRGTKGIQTAFFGIVKKEIVSLPVAPTQTLNVVNSSKVPVLMTQKESESDVLARKAKSKLKPKARAFSFV